MDPLIVQLSAGAVAGLIAQRFGIPILAGFVVAGVILTAAGYSESSLLTELSDFGVMLLLFTIGMHVDVRDVLRREVMLAGIAHWVLGGMVFVLISTVMGLPVQNALVIGAVLGFSSTVLAAQNLDRAHEVTAYHGRVAIGVLILQDLIALILLVIVASDEPHETALPDVLLLAASCGLAGFVAIKARERVLQLVSFILLVVSFSGLFHQVGLGHELGALVAGIAARRISGHQEVADALWGLKEYFLVGFFLQVGMQAQLEWGSLLLCIPLLLILPAKAVFFFFLLRLVGLRARTAFLTGSLLTSYSEFALIAGAIAAKSGYIDALWMDAITLSVVVAFVMYLPINRFNHRLYQLTEPFLERLPLRIFTARLDQLSTELHDAELLVVGLGRTGQAALKRADKLQKQAVGMDADMRLIHAQTASGRQAIVGDALDPHQWASLDLACLQGIVIALPGADARLNAVKLIRQAGYTGRLIAYAIDAQETELLLAAGANSVSTLLTDAGERMAEQAF